MSQLALFASSLHLCYGSTAIINILLFQCGDRLYTSELDVCRRQILTFKVGPRTERVDSSCAKSYKVLSKPLTIYDSVLLMSYVALI